MRNHEPIRDDTFVVRFGLMKLGDLQAAVARCNELQGFYGLSLAGENDWGPEEVAMATEGPWEWMRVSQAGMLREAGFKDLFRSGRRPHLTLRFAAAPTENELRALRRLFDEPVEKPHSDRSS